MKFMGIILLVLGLAWSENAVVLAQKEGGPVGIFNSQREYNQFMGSAKSAAYGPNGSPELQAMIPMLNDIVLNRPIGATANQYKTESMSFGLLSQKSIRSELEMVDSQYEELMNANRDIQKRMAASLRGLDFSDSGAVVEQIRSLRKTAREELEAILLPHQLERLKQLQFQSLLRRRSLVDVLMSEPMKSELEIENEQEPGLRKAEREIEEELAQQIAELRRKARAKLISRLKPKQQKVLKERMGELFAFRPETQSSKAGAKKKSRNP